VAQAAFWRAIIAMSASHPMRGSSRLKASRSRRRLLQYNQRKQRAAESAALRVQALEVTLLAQRRYFRHCGAGPGRHHFASTVRPLRRRLAMMARPSRVRILARKPCLRLRFRTLG